MIQRFTTSFYSTKAHGNTGLLQDALGAISLVVLLIAALHLPVLV